MLFEQLDMNGEMVHGEYLVVNMIRETGGSEAAAAAMPPVVVGQAPPSGIRALFRTAPGHLPVCALVVWMRGVAVTIVSELTNDPTRIEATPAMLQGAAEDPEYRKKLNDWIVEAATAARRTK